MNNNSCSSVAGADIDVIMMLANLTAKFSSLGGCSMDGRLADSAFLEILPAS